MGSTEGGSRILASCHVQDAQGATAERNGLARRIARSVCGLGTPQRRITIARFRDFCDYVDRTNVWRHLFVAGLTPLPSMVLTIALSAIPLQDPALGVWKNTGAAALHMGIIFFGMLGLGIMFRSSNHVPHDAYSNADVMTVCTLTAVSVAAFCAMIGYIWRFPVPFLLFIAVTPVIVIFCLAHMLLLRLRHQTSFELRTPLKKFLPFIVGQTSQVLVYVALSVVLTTTTEKGILVATGVVVVAKYSFRRLLRDVTSHLREDSNQLAVVAVEICASLYLSLILKRSPSYYATIGLLTVDVVHTAFVILAYMDKKCAVPRSNMIQATRGILGLSSPTWDDCELDAAATLRLIPAVHTHTVVPTASPSQPRNAKKSVVMTLEMLQVVETVIFIEYLECVVPATSTVFTLVASQFTSARYNGLLRAYVDDSSALASAATIVGRYAGLQTLTFVGLDLVLRYRYRISGIALLAYLLERHAWVIQGQLILWFGTLFELPVAHCGSLGLVGYVGWHETHTTLLLFM